jgi:PncC family amidohydrolase
MTALGLTLATAESCTGGLVAHRVTNVSGASSYFVGGVVAYANKAKTLLLDVSAEDLDRHGAVSEEVAAGMAQGVLRRFGADIGVGITGIAGPTGGSRDKPVGLVYVAVADGNGVTVARNLFTGSRREVKEQTADVALTMVWERIA